MKNILNKKEFLQIKTLKSYDELYEKNTEKLFESMDFSNKTGWSQSLIGRAVNKIFSFGARQAYSAIMSKLKDRLDDEYMKALLVTMKQKNIEESEAKSEMSDEEFDKNLEQSLVSVEKEQDLDSVDTQSTQNTENTKNDEISIKKFITKPDYNTAIKYQVVFLKNIINKIDSNKITEDDKAILKYVDLKLEKEIQKVSDEKLTNILNDTKNYIKKLISISEGDKSITEQEYKEKILNYTNIEKDKIIKEKTDLFQKMKNEYEQTLKLITDKAKQDELKKSYRNFTISVHPDKEKISVEDAKKAYNKFQEILKNIKETSTVSEGNEILLNEYIKELYDFSFNCLIQENIGDFINDTKNKISDSTKKFNDYAFKSKDKIKKQKLRDLLGNNDKNKDILDVYGDMSAVDFDPGKFMSKMDKVQLKEFKQKLISNVNKEALKEIQLKAEWMYDEDKYKDKRGDVYSRINWTTTGPDSNKLKNKWLSMVTNIKAKYNTYFSIDGNFPQELDPPALVNSDKAFRTKWDQYSTQDVKKGDVLLNSSNFNLSKDESDKLGLTKSTIPPKNVGIFECKTMKSDSKKAFGLIVYHRKIKNEPQYIFQLLGVYNTSGIAEQIKNYNINDDVDKIKEIIKNNIYTINTNIDDIKSDEMKKIFNAFININKNKEISQIKYKTTSLLHNNNISGGSNQYNFVYMVNTVDENKNMKTFVGVHQKNNPEINELSKYDNGKINITISGTPLYKYQFYIENVYSIEKEDLWNVEELKNLKKDIDFESIAPTIYKVVETMESKKN